MYSALRISGSRFSGEHSREGKQCFGQYNVEMAAIYQEPTVDTCASSFVVFYHGKVKKDWHLNLIDALITGFPGPDWLFHTLHYYPPLVISDWKSSLVLCICRQPTDLIHIKLGRGAQYGTAQMGTAQAWITCVWSCIYRRFLPNDLIWGKPDLDCFLFVTILWILSVSWSIQWLRSLRTFPGKPRIA